MQLLFYHASSPSLVLSSTTRKSKSLAFVGVVTNTQKETQQVVTNNEIDALSGWSQDQPQADKVLMSRRNLKGYRLGRLKMKEQRKKTSHFTRFLAITFLSCLVAVVGVVTNDPEK